MMLLEIIDQTAEKIKGQEVELNELDAVMGDGEHGSNMKKCFQAVQDSLLDWKEKNEKEILNLTGTKLLTAGGGTATTLIGFFLRRVAIALPESGPYEAESIAEALKQALDAVLEKSRAKEGDKTMMDALIPCVQTFNRAVEHGCSIPEAMEQSARAASEGAKATANMIAKKGRGLYVGERGIGTADPGAVSVSLIAESVSHCVNSEWE